MKYRQYILLAIAIVFCTFSLFTLLVQPSLASISSSVDLQPKQTASPTPASNQLSATPTPNIQPVGPTNTIKIVHEQPVLGINFDAWLASLLLPGETTQKVTLLLNNQGTTQVVLTNPALALVGQQTDTVPSLPEVQLPQPVTLPPQQSTPLTITIQSDMLVPDHYVGTIQYQIEGSTDNISIPLDISVRYGPFWPIIVLFLGILLGRLSLNMTTPTAVKQLDLLPRYYQLEGEINSITNPQTKKELSDELTKIYNDINFSDPTLTEDVVNNEIEQLEDNFKIALPNNLQAHLATLHGFAFRANSQRPDQPVLNGIYQVWTWMARTFAYLLSLLAGYRFPDAELRYWFVRPILAILLIILLLLIGLQTLYANAGATFGSAGLYDYLGLFLWGFSTDIATRSLQNLPSLSASK